MGDALLLDDRPSGGGRLEASVAEKMATRKKADAAIFGYARLDLIDAEEGSDFKWGVWNNRPCVLPQVTRLVQSFLINGVDRFSPMKSIPLVARPSDLITTSYSKTLTSVTETDASTDSMLPMLQLRAEVKGKTRLQPAGGMHRLKAVTNWVVHLKREYDALKKERKALAAQGVEETEAAEIEAENTSRKPRRDALAETLALKGQWMVILYDYGKSPNNIFETRRWYSA